MAERFEVTTRATHDAVDVTDRVAEIAGGRDGLLSVSTPHTTVGLVLGPGDQPMLRDFIRLAKQWPALHGPFEHFESDNPNAEAHLLSAAFGTHVLTFAGSDGLALGTYQRILLLEFDGPRTRRVDVRAVATSQPEEGAEHGSA